jgi:hypothetical protein
MRSDIDPGAFVCLRRLALTSIVCPGLMQSKARNEGYIVTGWPGASGALCYASPKPGKMLLRSRGLANSVPRPDLASAALTTAARPPRVAGKDTIDHALTRCEQCLLARTQYDLIYVKSLRARAAPRHPSARRSCRPRSPGCRCRGTPRPCPSAACPETSLGACPAWSSG